MGDRFYTEGNAMVDDDAHAEMRYQMMLDNDSDDNDLIDSSGDINEHQENVETQRPHDRVYTQENHYDRGEYFGDTDPSKNGKNDPLYTENDIHNYKGIYFNEEVGDNEKNHWEITGAHFKYDDAYRKLLKIFECQKQLEAKENIKKLASPYIPKTKTNKLNDVAKVKIILNSGTQNAQATKDFKPIMSNSQGGNKYTLERHLQSIGNRSKKPTNEKLATTGPRPSFKPQTTRIMPHLSSSIQKSGSNQKNMTKSKLSKIISDHIPTLCI